MKTEERKKLKKAGEWWADIHNMNPVRPYYNTHTGDWKCLDKGNPSNFEDEHGHYWSSNPTPARLIEIRRRLDVQARLGLPTPDHTPEFPAGVALEQIEGYPDYYYVLSSGARAYFFYIERGEGAPHVGVMEDVVRGGTDIRQPGAAAAAVRAWKKWAEEGN